jgi:hypothetical protein
MSSDIRCFFSSSGGRVNSTDAPTFSSDELSKLNKALVNCSTRTSYTRWTDQDRLAIGEYAVTHTIKDTVDKFISKHPSLKRQTVRNFKAVYIEHSKRLQDIAESVPDLDISTIELPTTKKRGRPTVLPLKLLDLCVELIDSLRLKGAVISGSVIKGILMGVLDSKFPNLIEKEDVNYDNVRQVLHHYQKKKPRLVRRKATTAKLPVPEGVLKEVKLSFQREISQLVKTHNIPESLVINHDQTPLTYISVSNNTLAPEGSKVVGLDGTKDKRQITGNFAVTLSGEFLPMQLIYQGKTKRSEPKIKFPEGFHVTHTHNHWSNTTTSVQFLEKIINPYVDGVRKDLNNPQQKALLISDVFRAQHTDTVKSMMEQNNYLFVKVPANMTQHFQPLDVSINGLAKRFMKTQYETWYADNILCQMGSGVSVENVKVDTRLTIIREVHARWICRLYDDLKERKEDIKRGFVKSGITEAVATDFNDEVNPFADLV